MISKTSNWFLYPIAPTHAPNDHKKSSFTAHALPVVVVEDGGTVSVVLEYYDWNYPSDFLFAFLILHGSHVSRGGQRNYVLYLTACASVTRPVVRVAVTKCAINETLQMGSP